VTTLEHAISLAAKAHEGQTDKAGAAYILHPLRVMLSLNTLDERITGVLHDVVEDCDGWSLDRLRAEGFSEAVVEAVDSVTRRPSEDYEAFVRRVAADPHSPSGRRLGPNR
jgi:(p)ppGpp synthase/HD superfamily hydrolase